MAKPGRPRKNVVIKLEPANGSQAVDNGPGPSSWSVPMPNFSDVLLHVSSLVMQGLLLGSTGNYTPTMAKKAVSIAGDLIREVESQ